MLKIKNSKALEFKSIGNFMISDLKICETET